MPPHHCDWAPSIRLVTSFWIATFRPSASCGGWYPALKARPPNVVDQILPDRFAMWAVLGIAKAPPGEVRVEQMQDSARTFWRLTDAAGRSTVYEMSAGALASVTREVAGRQTSQLRLSRGADGAVDRASLTDVQRSLRLEISITSREASDAFPPETWRLGP